MGIPVFQVDAFASHPFQGNPAAVCLLESARDPSWMQKVAAEMNLSETAFVQRKHDHFELRWFTPLVEADLCGHATLSAAHILWEVGWGQSEEELKFHTRSGWLTACRSPAGIQLDFPLRAAEPCEVSEAFLDALGIQPTFVGRNIEDYLLEVADEETVRRLRPDFARLAQIIAVRGVIVTSRASGGDCDFVSRFFAPGVGINEDPVTGSAHCCLADYWSRQLGKKELIGFQASQRGGFVHVQVAGQRVLLLGKAITVLRGELLL